MARTAVALLILFGLAAGVWWLWPSEDVTSSTTLLTAATTTTTASTSTVSGSSATTDSSHVVTTVEEAEAILRDLWFGWFQGIYNQDEDRIREVVATEEQVTTAREQFGVMEFIASPTPEAIVFSETEILRSDEQCLAVWNVGDATSFLGGNATRVGVDVMRRVGDSWILVESWQLKNDLWAQSCDVLL